MKRLVTALVLIPLVTYVMLWAPQWLFLVVLVTVASLCFYEYSGLVALHEIPAPGIAGFAAGLAVLLAPSAHSVVFSVVAIIALSLALRQKDLNEALPYASALVLGVVYIYGCWRMASLLRARSGYWLLFAIALNWVGDTAAYYVGRRFGRHRLAPVVSPKKSWEGSAASLAASVVFALVYFPRLLPQVPLPIAAAIAAAGNIAGQLGDLSESAIKRGAGVKDSGNLLPGHGGWLDRVDSVLFCLPVVEFLASRLT